MYQNLIVTATRDGKVITVTGKNQVTTLASILNIKPTAKNFDKVVRDARNFLAPYLAKAKNDKNLLSELVFNISTNPLEKDGTEREPEMLNEWEFPLSSIVNMVQTSVTIIRRASWKRTSNDKDAEPEMDILAQLS